MPDSSMGTSELDVAPGASLDQASLVERAREQPDRREIGGQQRRVAKQGEGEADELPAHDPRQIS